MPSSLSASRDMLIGALIGLARALSTNAPVETTNAVLLRALSTVSSCQDSSELDALTQIVRAEKFLVSPSCAACSAPCGATFDYDFSCVRSAPEDIRAAKHLMLAALVQLAGLPNAAENPAVMSAISEGLFNLADERPAADLLSMALSLGAALSNADL